MPFYYTPQDLKMPATQQLDGCTWVLERPFLYIRPNGDRLFVPPSGLGTLEDMVNCPVWTTDYGSIPAVVQNLFKRDGAYGPAYVLHDWLYISQKLTRAEADWILLEAMQGLGAWWLTRNTVYSAVRSAGWAAWNGHDAQDIKMLQQYELEFKAQLSLHDSPWRELAFVAA